MLVVNVVAVVVVVAAVVAVCIAVVVAVVVVVDDTVSFLLLFVSMKPDCLMWQAKVSFATWYIAQKDCNNSSPQ